MLGQGARGFVARQESVLTQRTRQLGGDLLSLTWQGFAMIRQCQVQRVSLSVRK
jgi:hypothetical protein